MSCPRAALVVVLALVGGLCTGARASGAERASVDGLDNRADPRPLDEMEPPTPKELRGIQIKDKVGERVPLDVKLVDHTGGDVTLERYLASGKPALLVLGYYQCPTLCSAILNGTLEALKEVSLDAGADFDVVVVSIDPNEGPPAARGKREAYVEAYGRPGTEEGWRFHTGTEAEVRRLADAVGFAYRWDEKGQQYAHAGGIFFLSPDGTLSRTLWGMNFPPRDVKFALMDAADGKVGTVLDQVMLSCFSYTPDSQRYGVYIWGVMRLGGVVTLIFLAALFLTLWRRYERRRRSRRAPGRAQVRSN